MLKMTRWVVGAALAGAAGFAMAGNGENLFQQDYYLLRSQNLDGMEVTPSAPWASASMGGSAAEPVASFECARAQCTDQAPTESNALLGIHFRTPDEFGDVSAANRDSAF